MTKEARDLGKLRERREAAQHCEPVKTHAEALRRLDAAIHTFTEWTERNIDSGRWSDRDEGWTARKHYVDLKAIRAALEA